MTTLRESAQQVLEAVEADLKLFNIPTTARLLEAIKALRQALEAEQTTTEDSSVVQDEPAAWIEHEWCGSGLRHLHFERREPSVRDEVMLPVWTPLYTRPQPNWWYLVGENQRLRAELKFNTDPQLAPQWVGLTDEDRRAVFESLPNALEGFLKLWGWLHFAKAVEAKLREKNGGGK